VIIEKLHYLTSSDFALSKFPEEEKELYQAAKAFLLSDEEKAEVIATKLFYKTTNDEIKDTAVSLKSGGAGGYRDEACLIIPEIEINIGEGITRLENLSLITDNEKSKSGFFITPGILGIDVARRNILTVDYFNRYVSIRK